MFMLLFNLIRQVTILIRQLMNPLGSACYSKVIRYHPLSCLLILIRLGSQGFCKALPTGTVFAFPVVCFPLFFFIALKRTERTVVPSTSSPFYFMPLGLLLLFWLHSIHSHWWCCLLQRDRQLGTQYTLMFDRYSFQRGWFRPIHMFFHYLFFVTDCFGEFRRIDFEGLAGFAFLFFFVAFLWYALPMI